MKKSALLILLACAGCTAYPTYPVLDATEDYDPNLTCKGLDREIMDANDLRDEILQAHGDSIEGAVTDTAVDAVLNPVNAVIGGISRSVGVSQATKHYAEATAAAGTRMEQLLRYKKEQGCPSGAVEGAMTTDGNIISVSMTDNDIVTMLDRLNMSYEAGEIDEKEYVRQRAEILNKVRY